MKEPTITICCIALLCPSLHSNAHEKYLHATVVGCVAEDQSRRRHERKPSSPRGDIAAAVPSLSPCQEETEKKKL